MLANDFPGAFLYSIKKIESIDINGKMHFASGFWYQEAINNHIILLLITAKHVFDNYSSVKLRMCRRNPIDGTAMDNLAAELVFSVGDINDYLIRHPDKDVCCLAIQMDDKCFVKLVKDPFIIPLSKDYILDISNSDDYMLMDDVVMIGCPKGIYDEYNNKPILTKGITSTPMRLNYNGESKYLINISCQHGSSGSPVFLANKGPHLEGNAFVPGNRMLLCGIFLGGWEEFTNAPDDVKAKIDGKDTIIKVLLPNNIGYVLKPNAINELMPLVAERLGI